MYAKTNASSVVSNRTPSLFTSFYIVILTDVTTRKGGIFSSAFPPRFRSIAAPRGCLCFRSGAFNRGLALIYFGNEGVTTRWAEGAAAHFYWYALQSHFASSLPAAVVTDFPIYAQNSTSFCSFSFLPLPSRSLALFFLTFCENVRFLLFVRASSKLLSEWLRRVVTRLTHVHSFPFSTLMSQFLRESGWISTIINLYNSRGNPSKFSSYSY